MSVPAIPPVSGAAGAAVSAGAGAAARAVQALAGASVAAAAPPPTPVDFPPEPLRGVCERLIARYPTREAALIPVLHLAQRHYGGWVSPEVEAGVARYLGVSDAHVRGVLTFYSMFHTTPRGEHEVWVCRTLTCWLKGAEDLKRAACRKAGLDPDEVGGHQKTGPDGRFAVLEMECLGLCEAAPAAFVDGEAIAPATPEALVRRMEECERRAGGAGEAQR